MSVPVTTSILRKNYTEGNYRFGVEGAGTVVCLVGSCRILPFLNMLRELNLHVGEPMELLCYDPIEMWTPGETGTDWVGGALGEHKIGGVDWLVCEHLVNCGVLNTRAECSENVFKDLGCSPVNPPIRLPNWNGMYIYDEELAGIRKEYAEATGSARVEMSPRSSVSPAATLRSIRRMILPERVLGSPGEIWTWSGLAIGPMT